MIKTVFSVPFDKVQIKGESPKGNIVKVYQK